MVPIRAYPKFCANAYGAHAMGNGGNAYGACHHRYISCLKF